MLNIKDYNKSIFFDLHNSPNLKFQKKLSVEINKEKNEDGIGINSFKNKLKKIDKNKFKNIPKNEKLMNFSTILNNNEHNIRQFRRTNKEYTHYANLLNSVYQNEFHFENSTNIKKKLNDSNLKVSSLIPISKKRFNKSKMKTIKEKDNLVSNILRKNGKKNNRRKGSYNEDKNSKNSKLSRKRLLMKCYSSHSLLKMKSVKRISNNKLEIDNIKNFLKEEEKVKKIPKKELNDKNNNNDEEDKKHINKNENNNNHIRDSKLSEKINNINKLENNKNEGHNNKNETHINKNENHNKNEKEHINNKIEKNENNNKKFEKKNSCNINNSNKGENQVDINNAKTRNENEIVNYTNKVKKKKHKGFPFCCLTIKGDNSSGDE